MKKFVFPILLVIAAIALVVLVSHTKKPIVNASPNPVACKVAMTKQLKEAMETGKRGNKPNECQGIDDKTLAKIAEEVLAEWK